MWKYKQITFEITNPTGNEIIDKMNDLSEYSNAEGWEIFSLNEKTVSSWNNVIGDSGCIIRYKIYLKKYFNKNDVEDSIVKEFTDNIDLNKTH